MNTPQPGSDSLLGRFRRWLHNWQEPVVWLPIVLLIMVGLFWLLPRLDPRSGIDGWGDLWQLAGGVVALFVVLFVAWLAKRTYFIELTDDEVRDLRNRGAEGSWQAVWILGVDRLEWAGLLCIAYLVLQR